MGKKYIDSAKTIETAKLYEVDETIGLVLDTAKAKFDEIGSASAPFSTKTMIEINTFIPQFERAIAEYKMSVSMQSEKNSKYHQGVVDPKKLRKYYTSCQNDPVIFRSGLEFQFIDDP